MKCSHCGSDSPAAPLLDVAGVKITTGPCLFVNRSRGFVTLHEGDVVEVRRAAREIICVASPFVPHGALIRVRPDLVYMKPWEPDD